MAIAQAILHDPDVLIMDEPTDGLDPNQKHQVRKLIAEMSANKAIIVSTHILEEVEAVCSRAIIINRGRIVADGTAEELLRRLPYHNAISMRVASGRVEAVSKSLIEFNAISKVETIATVNGGVQLRAYPRDGALSAPRARIPHSYAIDRSRRGRRRARQSRRGLPPDHHIRHRRRACMSSPAIPGLLRRREFAAYFASPLATIFLTVFVALTGAFTFYVGNFFERGQADLAPFFQYHPWLFLLLVPAVAMRLWAEERRSGHH